MAGAGGARGGWSIPIWVGSGGALAALVGFVGLSRDIATQTDIADAVAPLRYEVTAQDAALADAAAAARASETRLRLEIAQLRGELGIVRENVTRVLDVQFTAQDFEPYRAMYLRELDRLSTRLDEASNRIGGG